MNVILSIFCSLFLFVQMPATCFAQTVDTVSYSKKLLKLNLLQLSVGIEYKFSESVTGYFQAGFPWFIAGGEGIRTQIYFTPIIYPELRYYYNIKKRTKKNKLVEGFFANYFTLHGQVPLSQPDFIATTVFAYYSYYAGIHWGMQRRFFKNWYADINLGGGVAYYSDDFSIAPGALLAIGYAF